MHPIARRSVLALAMGAVFCFAGAASAAQPPRPGPATARAALAPSPVKFTDPDYVMGNPRAPVTVIEYASASCPHCARFDIRVFPALKTKYIDTGKVRYVFREFLTEPQDLAAATFVLARCAGKDKYFSVVEQVFRAQPEIYAKNDTYDVLLRIAKGAGLTTEQFNACLHDEAAFKALDARVNAAIDQQKVEGTPTFFINGRRFEGPSTREIEFADLERAIDPLLAASGRARPVAARRSRSRGAHPRRGALEQ